MASNECLYCGTKPEVGEIVEGIVYYTAQQWDVALRRWVSIAHCISRAEAEEKVATITCEWRIVKHTLTREIVLGNMKGNV